MANQQHLDILKQGVEAWDTWRKEHLGIRADLSGANLSGADLSGADLSLADLSGANLSGADLDGANLSGANLLGANLSGAYLSRAYLSKANLSGADLSGTYLGGADLSLADLSGANLSGADLSGTYLSGANLEGANLSRASLPQSEKERLRGKGVIGLEEAEMISGADQNETLEVLPDETALSPSVRKKPLSVAQAHPSIVRIRITEEPLTPQNLAIILTSLTELTTKFWLISKRRFADLIEYTQTHDVRFADEAGTTIAWITYNSPLNFGLNVDRVVPGAAEAVMTVVNGLTQRKAHLEQLEIENQAASQKIKEAEQKLKQQQEMAAIEREKQELELEKQRLEIENERQSLVEQRLYAQKKQIVDALEIASKAVDTVYPKADTEMRSVLIQTVMNNILQLQNIKGLELAPTRPKDQEEK